MLDFRLRTVASFVRQGSRLADIGTDHALLPCALVKEGVCPSAIASDVRVGPTEAANRSVSSSELEEKIEVRLGDGLSTIAPHEVDDIVIAGMGGETISAILQAAEWTKDVRYRLILQPMTHAEKLRRYLYENGFVIEEERIADDGRRCYTVICASYADNGFAPTAEQCYVGKVPMPEGKALLERICRALQKQQQASPDADVASCLAYIQSYIREGTA